MNDHFVKINSFRYVKKQYGLTEAEPTTEFVVRTTMVFNLADVISYTHPSECDTRLIAMKAEVEIDMKNLTAVRFKADGGSTTGWIDMQLSKFDEIFQKYLAEQGVSYDDYSTKSI